MSSASGADPASAVSEHRHEGNRIATTSADVTRLSRRFSSASVVAAERAAGECMHVLDQIIRDGLAGEQGRRETDMYELNC